MRSHSKSKVYFFFQKTNFSLQNRALLKKTILGIFKNEHKELDYISYIFCSDRFLLAINRKYLSRNYYTDIVTFDLSNSGGAIRAETYISIDRVKENAISFGVPFKSELYRVLCHGALHLCGYKDKRKVERLLIRKKEDHYLSEYFEV